MKAFSRLLILLAVLWAACGCEQDRYIVASGYAQGGIYSVKMNLSGVRERPAVIRHTIDSLLTEIDNTLSGYNKGSQLSRFNRGEDISPNAMFRDIYSRSYAFWEETDGALDVAAAPLFDAWGFGFSRDSLPSDEAVARLLATCGMKRLKGEFTDGQSLLKEPGGPRPSLNFNAVAQGYSCDVIAEYLRGIGVKDMLVDIGEIFCMGLNPDGKPWRLGVDRPEDGNNSPGASIEGIWTSDGGPHGVVTSGNYRKFYVRDGRKYAHTIDPRTGYPVSHNLLSATIVASDATTADAYATCCMVIGLNEAKALIEGRKDLEGYLIYDEDGKMKTWHSEGFNLTETNANQ